MQRRIGPLIPLIPMGMVVVRVILTELRYTPTARHGSFGALFGYRPPSGGDGPVRG